MTPVLTEQQLDVLLMISSFNGLEVSHFLPWEHETILDPMIKCGFLEKIKASNQYFVLTGEGRWKIAHTRGNINGKHTVSRDLNTKEGKALLLRITGVNKKPAKDEVNADG